MGYRESREKAIVDHDSNHGYLTSPKSKRNNPKLNNNSKIKRRQPEVNFMGYVITNQDLKPDPAKVDAIKGLKEMPRPACEKEVATLLSFMIYMSTFLPRLTEVTQPLCELTTKVAQFIDIE